MKRLVAILLTIGSLLCKGSEKTSILILTGEPEYGSEATLGALGRSLSKDHAMDVTHIHIEKKGDRHHFPGLAGISRQPDLLILYLRFLNLEKSDYGFLENYLNGPKPFIAVRTTTHLFDFPKGSELHTENRAFPTRHFGTPYRGHHGHKTSQINFVMTAKHPVMRGVDPRFWTPDFVYATNPLATSGTPLMIGQALKGLERASFKKDQPHNHAYVLSENDQERVIGSPHPVVWTVDGKDGKERSLVSTIGARKSFDDPNVQRLYLNAVFWSLGMEGPPTKKEPSSR